MLLRPRLFIFNVIISIFSPPFCMFSFFFSSEWRRRASASEKSLTFAFVKCKSLQPLIFTKNPLKIIQIVLFYAAVVCSHQTASSLSSTKDQHPLSPTTLISLHQILTSKQDVFWSVTLALDERGKVDSGFPSLSFPPQFLFLSSASSIPFLSFSLFHCPIPPLKTNTKKRPAGRQNRMIAVISQLLSAK